MKSNNKKGKSMINQESNIKKEINKFDRRKTQ